MVRLSRILKDITACLMISGIMMFMVPDDSLCEIRHFGKRARRPAISCALTEDTYISEDYKASFNEIVYRGLGDETAKLWIDGSTVNLKVYSDYEDKEADMAINEYFTGDMVKLQLSEGELQIDCTDVVKEGALYYLDFIVVFEDMEMADTAVCISADENGNVLFIEPPALEYNEKMLQKLYSFSDPYKDFLGSQTDVETENYDVQKFGLDLCKDCEDDSDKVFAIYSYIVEDLYYDNDFDVDQSYEDDVLSVIRRKVGICEGFSNVFVALCRVNGIPATEVHGCAYETNELWDIDYNSIPYDNHAWVAFYLDGEWYMADPTWDNYNTYEDGEFYEEESMRDFLFMPVESMSYSHLITNADFSHAIASEGKCGDSATFKITDDGVCTIYGSGEISMPTEVKDFFELRFAEDSEITSIGVDGFIDCDLLKNVYLPDTLEEICDGAFCSCEDLEYVYIPDSVRIIRYEAFESCDKLAYVSVPDDTVIDKYAFDYCPRLVLEVKSESYIDTSDYSKQPAKIVARK